LPYYSLYFLDLINRKGHLLSEEDQQVLKEFQLKFPNSTELKQIRGRLLLLTYDGEESEDKQMFLVGKMASLFKLNKKYSD
jgi:hypothetical protein